MTTVEVSGLTVALNGTGSRIVDDITLTVERGKVMGLVGESGSGKSTLALALLGFVRRGAAIVRGSVVIDGTDILAMSPAQLRHARRHLLAFVPQDPATALNPALKLRTQLLEGLDGTYTNRLRRVRQILEAVGLPSSDAFLGRRPSQLSGGQQQRVAIAIAVAARPRLIVLDEPTTGLDVATQAMVLELVKRLCRENNLAALYVSHDLAVVGAIADHVTVMYGGQVVESGRSDVVLRSPAHPYTRALMNSVPSARERLRLEAIPGRAPEVGAYRSGCVFADRCSFVIPSCLAADPPLIAGPMGGVVRCIRASDVLANALPSAKVSGRREMGVIGATPHLLVAGVNAWYGARQALLDVSFSVARGECVAIVGESGSGKTTLSRCLIGLHGERDGEIVFDGVELARTARERSVLQRQSLQYVFQNPYGSLNPRHSIQTSLEIPLRHFHGVTGSTARARARDALERVEVSAAFASRFPAELSGGQRQRVAIARALVCEPTVLICDEVTSALDVSVQASVVELLRSLLDDGLSMVFVTHNLAVVRSIADSVVVLNAGRVVESGASEQVLMAPRHEYTRALMAHTLEVTA